MVKLRVRDVFTREEAAKVVEIFVNHTFRSDTSLSSDEVFEAMFAEVKALIQPHHIARLETSHPGVTVESVATDMLVCLTESCWKKIAAGEIQLGQPMGEA